MAVGFGGNASLDWESNCKDDLKQLVSVALVDDLIRSTMFLTLAVDRVLSCLGRTQQSGAPGPSLTLIYGITAVMNYN